ncbi:unnamed protein product [Angiostrongylus costaricensis]|uniref:TPT domain-containing protein n=1 Tax=Angiostrongylus costaricensis TaxID=334426 RepID=A0A0R3PXY1_ANGCS|nr:unnamed protein product [Angiostrongylus costaricensis]
MAFFHFAVRQVLISIAVIGMVAVTWAMSTQFSKTALVIDPTHFYAPYLMMWFNTNFMMVCYPVYLIYELILSRNWPKICRASLSVFGEQGVRPWTVPLYVGPFLLFWIGANYTYSASLLYISASMATTISSCNAAMVYMLALLLLAFHMLYHLQLFSVGFAIAGVVVISLGGEIRVKWQGVALSVCSAASAALYKVLFKRLLGNASLGQVSLFMTCLGFLNLICNWLPMFILQLTNVEHMEIAFIPWVPVIGAALLSLLFNFLINFGIALLHPLVISVGMLMGIPFNTGMTASMLLVKFTSFFQALLSP